MMVRGRLRTPPEPSISEVIQNAGGNPNAEVMEPNAIGLITLVNWFTITFNPNASPERPSGELANISMVTIGAQHPMPSPNMKDNNISTAAAWKNGTSIALTAPR